MSAPFDRVKAVRSGLAILATGLLIGLNGAAPAAYALPGDPGDGTGTPTGCVPQPVAGGADALLDGTLHLLDGPLVGFDTRISMDGASLKVPNPTCEGKFLNVPLKFAWSISGRPSGSGAGLSQSTSLTPHLVPDKVGAWQVTFTACPNGCTLNSPNIRVGPITRTLNFNAVKGVEGRISSDALDSTLKLLLAGSRIQISQTGAGQTVAGSQSFVDFGPTAEQNGAPPALALPIDPPVQDVPDSVQAILLLSQGPVAVVAGTNIDQVRVRANNVHLDLSNLGRWGGSIANGGLNLGFSFDSNHPAIKCEAHYTVKSLFLITLDEGWSDDLCPDFDLRQMDLGVTLFPTVVNGQVAVAGNQVSAHFVPGSDVRTELVDLFTGATSDLQTGVSSKLHAKLDEPGVKAGLGLVLNGLLKHQFSDLGPIVSMQIVGSDWVIRYQSTAGQTTCAPRCIGPATQVMTVAP